MPVSIPGKSIKTPTTTCLVIAPFDTAGSRIKDTIQRALEEVGINSLSLDNLQPGASWVNAVTDAIKFSDFIVVDVSRQNPNVMYELGYAHALRKPTILLMSLETASSIPSDLQGHLYVAYDPKNLHSLREEIIRASYRYKVSGGGK